MAVFVPERHTPTQDDQPADPDLHHAVGLTRGREAEAYADAVTLYLALAVSRLADWSNNQCKWEANGEVSQQMYSGQAMGIAWDVSEANVLGEGNSGSFLACLKSISGPLRTAHPRGSHSVQLADARDALLGEHVVATDPPYFDNIDYSDLSDFFYVWQRRMLASIFPDLFGTMLVPKGEELVANAHRTGGNEAAARAFVAGFTEVFSHWRTSVSADYPVVVYYASKQAESLGAGNSRWSTILQAMVDSKWQVVRTWPLRTENVSRRVAIGNNSMSTSTVLVLRPRPADAQRVTIPEFLSELRDTLAGAVRELEEAGIAPVDMQQAAIGPGIEVFSKYAAVLESGGSPMTVAAALGRINEVLDEIVNEQEGDFDAPTRFAVQWYRRHSYVPGPFGEADDLARARNTSVDVMAREGILTKHGGKVQLIEPSALSSSYDPETDLHVSQWEILHHTIRAAEQHGVTGAGSLLRDVLARPDNGVDLDLVKELGHLMFHVSEDNGWTREALQFNGLVASWPEILDVARTQKKPTKTQFAIDFDEDE